MTAFENFEAIERAVRGLTARLTRLRGVCGVKASADDVDGPSSHDVWRDLCDGALRDCQAIETLTLRLKPPSIDCSNDSLNLRLMQTLVDVIATRSDGVKRALLYIFEKIRRDPADTDFVTSTTERRKPGVARSSRTTPPGDVTIGTAPFPTLPAWVMVALTMLLASAGLVAIRRRPP